MIKIGDFVFCFLNEGFLPPYFVWFGVFVYVTEKGEENGGIFQYRKERPCQVSSERHTICSYGEDVLCLKLMRHPKENL